MRSSLRQERLEWEKADAASRAALSSLREEWRMLQQTNAQLHAAAAKAAQSLTASCQRHNAASGCQCVMAMQLVAAEDVHSLISMASFRLNWSF